MRKHSPKVPPRFRRPGNDGDLSSQDATTVGSVCVVSLGNSLEKSFAALGRLYGPVARFAARQGTRFGPDGTLSPRPEAAWHTAHQRVLVMASMILLCMIESLPAHIGRLPGGREASAIDVTSALGHMKAVELVLLVLDTPRRWGLQGGTVSRYTPRYLLVGISWRWFLQT